MQTDDARQPVEDPCALIPDVGNVEAVSAEVLTSFYVENRCVRVKAYTHTERN